MSQSFSPFQNSLSLVHSPATFQKTTLMSLFTLFLSFSPLCFSLLLPLLYFSSCSFLDFLSFLLLSFPSFSTSAVSSHFHHCPFILSFSFSPHSIFLPLFLSRNLLQPPFYLPFRHVRSSTILSFFPFNFFLFFSLLCSSLSNLTQVVSVLPSIFSPNFCIFSIFTLISIILNISSTASFLTFTSFNIMFFLLSFSSHI